MSDLQVGPNAVSKRGQSMPKNSDSLGLGSLGTPTRPKRTSLELTGLEKHGCLDDKHA